MTCSPGVCIDAAHCDLLAGLVRAHKPETILEFGFGGGNSLDAMYSAAASNGNLKSYELVDSWADWGGQQPDNIQSFRNCFDRLTFLVSDEGDFVATCSTGYDFILSDADHSHTHEWFDKVYHVLLNAGGILVYHDAANVNFEGIGEIFQKCRQHAIPCVLFNKNSQPGECCDRGILVIFKPVALGVFLCN